jgi:tRNA(Ile)-lysidine synthase
VTGDPAHLLARCAFPARGRAVDLAVSGGPDSTGLLLLALAGGLAVTVHHVDHAARPTSAEEADTVRALGSALGVEVVVHVARVEPGPNFEARARAARRAHLPAGALTGHTMDDLAETVLVNLLRGAGLDGIAPMVGDPTKPLLALRREELRAYVAATPHRVVHDESNDSPAFVRNRVRHEVLPLLDEVAGRDVTPLLARLARVAHAEVAWLDELSEDGVALEAADCRALATWPEARLRRWLRARLASPDAGDGAHPPSADEIERALAVVRGESVATELAGGRRLARRGQRLSLGDQVR